MITSLLATDPQNTYEWLENSENIQTQDWIKKQRSLFNDYQIKKTNYNDNETRESLKKLTNFDEYSIPKKIGSHYFYTSKKSSEKQYKLYVQNGLNDRAF